jgi:hypothetical protein
MRHRNFETNGVLITNENHPSPTNRTSASKRRMCFNCYIFYRIVSKKKHKNHECDGAIYLDRCAECLGWSRHLS